MSVVVQEVLPKSCVGVGAWTRQLSSFFSCFCLGFGAGMMGEMSLFSFLFSSGAAFWTKKEERGGRHR